MRSHATLIMIAALTGCAAFDEGNELLAGIRLNETAARSGSANISNATNMPDQQPGIATFQTNPEACSSQLVGHHPSAHNELDSGNISIVNWNIHKGVNPQWTIDLATFEGDPDLMVFQEAALNSNAWGVVTADQYHSFSPGYRTRQSLTGVMTVSAVKPLTQCNLVSVEPWLRSPKATVITEYGLTGTDLTLLLVNIHVVGFTFGTFEFRQQILQAKSVLDNHAGPILLSGDFNTWRWRRSEILDEMTDSLGLEKLAYDEDHRKRVFGQPLDHIYVRGLEVIEATTHDIASSDHNPMSARLRL